MWEQEQLTNLRLNIIEHFSKSELKTLCVDLGESYDTLPDGGIKDNARELVDLCRREGKLDAPLTLLQ